MNRKSDLSPDECDFEPDDSIVGPTPLDPDIANVWLRTKSNSYADGYPLELLASFGKEIVVLGDQKLRIPVEISFEKAAIDVRFSGCSLSPIFDVASDEYSYRKTSILAHGVGANAEAEGSLTSDKPQGFLRAKITGKAHSKRESEQQQSVLRNRQWRRTGEHRVQLMAREGFLDGEVINNEPAWFVTPKNGTEQIYVEARLTTRAEWIVFGAINTSDASGEGAKSLAAWYRRASTRDKELYRLLLSTLVAKGLQPDHSHDATLAVFAHVMRRIDPDRAGLLSVTVPASGVRHVAFDSTPLLEFQAAPPEKQISLLQAQGAPLGSLNRILSKSGEMPKPSRGLFNAGSAPPTALAALRACIEADNSQLSTEEWDRINKNRSRQDLIALGLISVEDKVITSLVPNGIDPEEALRYEARKAPMLRKARNILLDNPRASGVEIGDAVGREFNRRYDSDASKLRVGNSLRRWAFWLEEGLIDPQNPGGLARLRAVTKRTNPVFGAPTAATEDNLDMAQRALDAGQKAEDIARRLGVSRAAFYRWAKIGLLSLPSKRKKPR